LKASRLTEVACWFREIFGGYATFLTHVNFLLMTPAFIGIAMPSLQRSIGFVTST
jgi:hypothetical protein